MFRYIFCSQQIRQYIYEYQLTEPPFQIEKFFADKLDTLGPGRAAYESALQSIRGNIAWREEHESAVEEAVADQGN